jgi:hypothetical protein
MLEVLRPAQAANLLSVTFLSSTSVWLALMSGAQASNQPTLPLCTAIDVAVSTATPIVKRGTAPVFSVRVSNTGKVSTHVLNVRDGRRSDLQETYFELFVEEDGRVLDLPMAISDPGPVSADDYLHLRPGDYMEVRPLSYKRLLGRLAPGQYSAYVRFWRLPELPSTSGCRSSEARFRVSE